MDWSIQSTSIFDEPSYFNNEMKGSKDDMLFPNNNARVKLRRGKIHLNDLPVVRFINQIIHHLFIIIAIKAMFTKMGGFITLVDIVILSSTTNRYQRKHHVCFLGYAKESLVSLWVLSKHSFIGSSIHACRYKLKKRVVVRWCTSPSRLRFEWIISTAGCSIYAR